MLPKNNGITMTVSYKETVTVYHNSVWFIKKSITNTITLINLRLQYLITYRSKEMMFIVHRYSNNNHSVQNAQDQAVLILPKR